MDIYNAVKNPGSGRQSRIKLAVGPEGATIKDYVIGGEKIPAGSLCYLTGFDKRTGTFEGILKNQNKERV